MIIICSYNNIMIIIIVYCMYVCYIRELEDTVYSLFESDTLFLVLLCCVGFNYLAILFIFTFRFVVCFSRFVVVSLFRCVFVSRFLVSRFVLLCCVGFNLIVGFNRGMSKQYRTANDMA